MLILHAVLTLLSRLNFVLPAVTRQVAVKGQDGASGQHELTPAGHMPAVSDAFSKTGAGKQVTRATQSTLVAMLERLECSGNKQQVGYVSIVYS